MSPLLADVVWPALYIMERSYTWWGIAVGLIIEYLTLRGIADVSWSKSAVAVMAINAATALIGYVAIPLLTVAWEFILNYTVYQIVRVGTFNPFGWASTVIMMGAITGFPEYFLLTKVFNIQFRSQCPWLWWWLANCASVFIAFVTVLIWPVYL